MDSIGGTAASPQLVLVRLSGDIGTKARGTRARFVARLQRNVRDALRSSDIEGRLVSTRNRLYLEASSPDAVGVLARVPGIQSLSLALRAPETPLDALVARGAEIFGERVRGRRFAVRAKRVGSRAPGCLATRDVEHALGRALLDASAGVDLDHPEVTAFVELCEGVAYFFPERVAGPGGLPLGVGGRAVALVSGGFDSAVAAWLVQKRGVALDHVFCNLGGIAHELGVLRVMKVVADRWSYGTRPRLHAVDFQPLAEELQAKTQPRYWQVLLKRLMLRAAEAVARERRALAVVTGDALGQVSSQTLANLAAISTATALPILRPVLGLNKDEILELARRLGTFELSAVVGEYCALVPSRPATEADPALVAAEEAKLDRARLEAAVAARKVIDLRAVDPEACDAGGLEVDTIPEGASVIDLRSLAAFKGWHWPGALWLEFPRALSVAPRLPADRRYVVYCDFALKSAHLAEVMRKHGLDAAHLRGGLKRAVVLARERGLGGPEL
ncbi:MAG TPA: tRNA uracil 4-sulfurtransferase ThiI [Myxococcota bacterium]|jgi:thiamine biosynthesis protein ThiI|nr:tRNA uracil 4-sulfurtransferase ThiI [Myxococcota bacterium]